MDKIILKLENGKNVNLNKSQIAYYYEHGNKKYTIVMSTGDALTGTTETNI